MKFLDIDFETRSEVDLLVVGAKVYADHHSTEVLMISFSIDEVNIFNWNPHFPIRKNYRKLERLIGMMLRRDDIYLRAHNAEFEYWIWNMVATRMFGWPALPVEKLYDTMVCAGVLGLPLSLENAAEVLKLSEQKDKRGKQLIQKFCKPSRKQGIPFNTPEDNKGEFLEFVEYCDQDVRTQIAIAKACPAMTKRQRDVYILTEKMNIRGLPIDSQLARGALDLVDQYKASAQIEIQELTSGEIESATQNVMLLRWINENGGDLPDLTAPTIEKYLSSPNTPDLIKAALTIRSNVSKSSTAKYAAALTYLTEANRVHGFLKAFIAKTGRWGGRGLQIQNFSKPDKNFPDWCNYDTLASLIHTTDMRLIETIYDGIMATLKAATRSMICAIEGHKFICADYAQIEARIVMWLAGDKTGINDFLGEGKIYENMAAQVFNMPAKDIAKPSFERDVGKEAVLGCGFGMGDKKFTFRCVEQRNLPISPEIGKKAVKGYRDRYPAVPDAWKATEKAAINAIQNPGSSFKSCDGRLVYKMVGSHLAVQLPSKRRLYYPFAKTSIELNDWGHETTVVYYKTWVHKAKAGQKWKYEKIWGGTFFQHSVQAIAMDIMSYGMLNAEMLGYPALFTVHDESLSMVKKSFGSVKEYEDILCQLEPWAEGLPIVAEGWEGNRYKK